MRCRTQTKLELAAIGTGGLSFAIGDTQSGMRAASMSIDGKLVTTVIEGGVLSYRPESDLALGTHTITVTASDTVGNTRSITRSFVMRDTTAPQLSINSPAASGGNRVVLDVSASDDKAGIEAIPGASPSTTARSPPTHSKTASSSTLASS